jgi:hypothetical protein
MQTFSNMGLHLLIPGNLNESFIQYLSFKGIVDFLDIYDVTVFIFIVFLFLFLFQIYALLFTFLFIHTAMLMFYISSLILTNKSVSTSNII